VLAQGYWRWADAEREQRRAIALDPDHAEAHRRLSIVMAVLGQRDEALSEAERALALEPTAPAMHLEVAHRLAAFGRVDEATAKLNEALRLEPSNRLPHVNLAELAALRGDFPRRADELSQLFDLVGVGTARGAWAGGGVPQTSSRRWKRSSRRIRHWTTWKAWLLRISANSRARRTRAGGVARGPWRWLARFPV
jgi:Flp pilus assembly protein TadD